MIAFGSVTGISSSFNTSVAGCFIVGEYVLGSSPTDSSSSLTHSTLMGLLSSVIVSVISEVLLALILFLHFQNMTLVFHPVDHSHKVTGI